jgi:hypothetical protein
VSKLSQAAAHPRRGTIITQMEFPARNDGHATQQKKKKQRRKNVVISKIYMQEMLQEQPPKNGGKAPTTFPPNKR